ncbi:hypothetical protein BGZ49_010125 [Haplosporangium sp. Z 27]|nr:hypothetical protein BGZ49_010125 [Haplosporangium sp. Z 27]
MDRTTRHKQRIYRIPGTQDASVIFLGVETTSFEDYSNMPGGHMYAPDDILSKPLSLFLSEAEAMEINDNVESGDTSVDSLGTEATSFEDCSNMPGGHMYAPDDILSKPLSLFLSEAEAVELNKNVESGDSGDSEYDLNSIPGAQGISVDLLGFKTISSEDYSDILGGHMYAFDKNLFKSMLESEVIGLNSNVESGDSESHSDATKNDTELHDNK